VKLFSIFGNPVSHSKSPQLHNASFAYLGEKSSYIRTLLEDGKALRKTFDMLALDGANITVPHKEEAYAQADEVRGLAKEIGAVNTLVREGDKVIGYNTDCDGFMQAISSFSGIKTVLILGAGGTAKAIALALRNSSFEVTVVNRSEGRLDYFQKQGFICASWERFEPQKYDLIVNTTSAGLSDDNYPLDKAALSALMMSSTAVVDAIYGKMTPFLKLADALDIPYKDGGDMLVGQAVIAFEHFVGHKIDRDVIHDVMQKAIQL
jgi:shikimate dehydrogenase